MGWGSAFPPHWAHCCTQQISSLCYTSGVFWERTGCLRGWLRAERSVCVRTAENTHIHNQAQRIRPRCHHRPTLEHLCLPPFCQLGRSPPMPGCFGWSASLISTYTGEGKPGWRRGQAWAHPINPPPPNHPFLTPPFYPSISKPECINLPFLTAAINKGRSEPCVMGG